MGKPLLLRTSCQAIAFPRGHQSRATTVRQPLDAGGRTTGIASAAMTLPSQPIRPRGCAGACSIPASTGPARAEYDSERAGIGVTAMPRKDSPGRQRPGRFRWQQRKPGTRYCLPPDEETLAEAVALRLGGLPDIGAPAREDK